MNIDHIIIEDQIRDREKMIKEHNDALIAGMIVSAGILQVELDTFKEKFETFCNALDTKDPEKVKRAYIEAFHAFDPANSRVITISSLIQRLKL
ncbi:MAG: hypothetical protein ACFB2Y_09680 [Fulvivirga sp.]